MKSDIDKLLDELTFTEERLEKELEAFTKQTEKDIQALLDSDWNVDDLISEL